MPLGETFDQVLAAARAGADWAWEEIYRDIAPVMLGYLRGQNAPDPEGIMGEAFLQIVRDLHTFDGDEEKFRSWVFTIAHHRLIDARRKAKRRPFDPTPHEDMARESPVEHAEEDVLGGLEAEELRHLIDELTDDQRSVVLLRVVADLSIQEVAETLGKSQGAVKQLQRRGLASLRRRIEGHP